jgi:putative PIN family toxin of toxin-antitoxin system
MRIVLDTNVLARAAGSRTGPAGELFERVAAAHALIVSQELLTELGRVLSYDRLRRVHRLGEADVNEFIESVKGGASLVSLPDPPPRIVPYDSDDDIVVATAIAGGADTICTRNRHLFHEEVVAYCGQYGIEILDDISLLGALRELGE